MASIEEITAQLERQLAEATGKIDEFVVTQSSNLQKAAADHETLMRNLESKLRSLEGAEATAANTLAATHADLEGAKRAVSEKTGELTALQRQSQSLPVEVDAAKTAESEARLQLDRNKQELERREAEVRFQLQELTKGVSYYRRLGLDFEKIADERLRLVFTLIDPLDPTRKFGFNLRVESPSGGGSEEEASYSVDGVDPPLIGGTAALAELVSRLNSDNDFSAFVQAMRRKFVEVATAQQRGGGGLGGAGRY